jgi:hypothetical protein
VSLVRASVVPWQISVKPRMVAAAEVRDPGKAGESSGAEWPGVGGGR